MASKKITSRGVDDSNNVHVRIDFDTAVDSKKNVLVGQIDILKLMKGINRYFSFRRRELELREELKKESKELSNLIIDFKQTMPKVEETDKSRIKEDLTSIGRREVLESDLDSIRQKLARLGGF